MQWEAPLEARQATGLGDRPCGLGRESPDGPPRSFEDILLRTIRCCFIFLESTADGRLAIGLTETGPESDHDVAIRACCTAYAVDMSP
jgi:hypothetical protein